jgi:hypothetical protein
MMIFSPLIPAAGQLVGAVLLQFVGVALYVVTRDRLEKRVDGMPKRWKQLILSGITVIWVLGFSLGWQSSRNDLFRIGHWLVQVLGWGLFQWTVAGMVAAVGGLAYWFKSQNQFLYGLVELPVALATAMFSAGGISSNRESFSRVATIAGCVYIVSRGLENMEKGGGGSTKTPPEKAPAIV